MNKPYQFTATTIGAAVTTVIIFLFAVLSQPIFAAAATTTTEKMNVDLVVDSKTLKIQDINNNKKPDPGEVVTVLGKLYTAGTKNEIGTYRCTFPWEGYANSTQDTPITLAIQVFDMKEKGNIVVVGDEPSVDAVGKPVAGVIAGGTGQFFGTRGTGTLTAENMQGTDIPVKVVFDIERSSATASTSGATP